MLRLRCLECRIDRLCGLLCLRCCRCSGLRSCKSACSRESGRCRCGLLLRLGCLECTVDRFCLRLGSRCCGRLGPCESRSGESCRCRSSSLGSFISLRRCGRNYRFCGLCCLGSCRCLGCFRLICLRDDGLRLLRCRSLYSCKLCRCAAESESRLAVELGFFFISELLIRILKSGQRAY